MDDDKPIDLASRRAERKRRERRRLLDRYRPSYAVMMWALLFAAALLGYLLFGESGLRKADLTGSLYTGAIGACGLIRRTCLVDGDTGWQDGIKWRMLGIDAPEIDDKAGCAAEREKATASLERLTWLMADGYRIKPSGRKDRFGRALVDVELKDGRDAGRILMQEGLAQPWPNSGNVWCDR